MSITAKELARRLRLSEAAVSLALRNKSGVSESTRRAVVEAAREAGYDFSRTLPYAPAGGSAALVVYKKHGAVISDTPFFAQVTEGIAIGCKLRQASLSVNYIYSGEEARALLRELSFSGCLGVILLATEMEEADFAPFLGSSLPLVVLDAYYEGLPADCVMINNVQGAYLAANYIIRKYRRQPGYLHSSYPIANFSERADGFYKAVRKNGLSSSRCIVHPLSPSAEGAYADMRALLRQSEETAGCYFADNDLIAAGAIKALLESGLRIPQDVAVVGFDDMPIHAYTEPALTTVHVPKRYMGQLAAERLFQITAQKDTLPVKTCVATTLKIRRSA